MKQFIRRLSRVADSSHYCLLRSHSQTPSRPSTRPKSFRPSASVKLRRDSPVPQGCIPVCVGDEMQRFVISAELLNRPVFVELLDKSAQEYGYEQKGALRIPCSVLVFERVLEALRLGNDAESLKLDDLLASFPDEML